ncbi:hypothetical protein ACF1HJ_22850 [Streptomyces sp. NPDC013978]
MLFPSPLHLSLGCFETIGVPRPGAVRADLRPVTTVLPPANVTS